MHTGVFDVLAKVPPSQMAQAEFALSFLSWYWPGGHPLQTASDLTKANPAAQNLHGEVDPLELEYVPGSQIWHTSAVVCSWPAVE